MNSIADVQETEFEWSMLKTETISQSHLLSEGAPITHPLLADAFLKTADVIRISIHGNKPIKLDLIDELMQKIADAAPDSTCELETIPTGPNGCLVVTLQAERVHPLDQ